MRKIYILTGAALAVGLSLSAPPAKADECRADWRADFGAHTIGYLWAVSGRPCISPLYTGYGEINSVSIVSPAREGTATVEARNSFIYRSRPGFVGQDHFVLAIDGMSSNGVRGITTVAFEVTVTR